jgi:hypothetical protein
MSEQRSPSPTPRPVPVNDFASRWHGQRHRLGEREYVLMQSIFRMGFPSRERTSFPSNIQGLATWYEIRVSKDGTRAVQRRSTSSSR